MVKTLEEIRNRKHKRRPKNFYRQKYMIGIYSFIAVITLVLLSPLYAGRQKSNSVINENPSFLDNSQIVFVSSEIDSKDHLVRSQFFIGNPENVDDVSDIKALTNIKYNVKTVPKNGQADAVKTKVIRVNDNFMEVISSGIESDFGILKYEITPELINKQLDTELPKGTQMKIYVKNKNVQNGGSQLTVNESEFTEDYNNYVRSKYQKQIANLEKDITKARASIKEDRRLINSLEIKVVDAVGQAKTDIESQISDAKGDIESQKDVIKTSKKNISMFREKIINLG